MSTLGFDNYVEPLKLYLQKYREGMKGENKVRTVSSKCICMNDLVLPILTL